MKISHSSLVPRVKKKEKLGLVVESLHVDYLCRLSKKGANVNEKHQTSDYVISPSRFPLEIIANVPFSSPID